MAICINGLNDNEMINLTEAIVNNTERWDLHEIDNIKIDKFSTNKSSDKITLVVLPLVCACGVNISKISTNGLQNSIGIIDKLESIKGFNANLSCE